ncbi:MAG: tRNA (adenosine(37)-N6)-threonylcarbamoyltransferase complex transferase subunit TsaD [Anaerolineae bacterium]|nr:tRNA (adenosine(37)-N6)-threonylcarbamoyltransferase complex transferase subunit TsaD [Anaerolineae bacterium]
MTLILGIETSCDETAAAVVADGQEIRSNVVESQVEIHQRYGGVFPEVASRQHVLSILPVIGQAMAEAEADWDDLDAVAVTHGPGLAGSLLVGVNAAKGLAWGRGLPLVGVNHIEAHIYGNWLAGGPPPEFPLICLVVSGGHSELIWMTGHGQYRRLGGTLDDAAGEAFDKVGRLLGLPYPGGPSIQRAARGGSPEAFKLPRAWLPGSYDFSFSGLKTAMLQLVQKYQPEGDGPQAGKKRAPTSQPPLIRVLPVADLAASFQAAVIDVLVTKTAQAAQEMNAKTVLLAGGVAANELLRAEMARSSPAPVCCPPPELCTDNAAIVATAGFFRFQAGQRSGWELDVVPGLRLATEQDAPAS